MICNVSTRVRRYARNANDTNPIEQHDALCEVHGVVSENWTTLTGAQIAAERHAATAPYSPDAVSSR